MSGSCSLYVITPGRDHVRLDHVRLMDENSDLHCSIRSGYDKMLAAVDAVCCTGFNEGLPIHWGASALRIGRNLMRLPNTFGQRAPFRFNITPMIDVVFLLIIFFLVASYFVRSEQSREVTLPTAAQGNPDDQSSLNRLTITIEKDGRHSIGGQLLSESTVLERIAELQHSSNDAGGQSSAPEVRIRADRDAKYVTIRKLIEHCAAHNISSIRFAIARETTQ